MPRNTRETKVLGPGGDAGYVDAQQELQQGMELQKWETTQNFVFKGGSLINPFGAVATCI